MFIIEDICFFLFYNQVVVVLVFNCIFLIDKFFVGINSLNVFYL